MVRVPCQSLRPASTKNSPITEPAEEGEARFMYKAYLPKYAFGRHRRLGASGVGGLGLFGAAVRSLELTIWLNSICAGGDAVGPPDCSYGILEELNWCK